MKGVLTLNAGSSSLKFGLYDDTVEPRLRVGGQVDGIGRSPQLVLEAEDNSTTTPCSAQTHRDALAAVLDALAPYLEGLTIAGIGHRVVHGGPDFSDPVRVTPEIEAALTDLVPLAPLHQPHNLAGIAAARDLFPDAVQVACFDTAFHRGHPWVNDTFALPRRFYDAGIRRYGFHGLSYDYVTGVIERDEPDLHAGRVIVAHLGNGASMCAIREGDSVASTMGFSALDGLPMGTRCGQLDPGVVLYLLEHEGLTPAELTELLYKESGLKGLSGWTNDMRVLEASEAPAARQALDYFVFRIRRELGAMCAVLGGIDALVFCGGIGENAAGIRARVCRGMEWIGVTIDADANDANATRISRGPTEVLVVPTDEERVIARHLSEAVSAAK